MNPISGIRNSSSHHPDRPVSCSRRTATARLGRKVASDQIDGKTPGLE